MAKGGKKEHLARVLDSHIHNIEETLQMLERPAVSQKVDWSEVTKVGDEISKQATVAGMLWNGEHDVKNLESNMGVYINFLQGFLLLCHSSSAGAGPTLHACIVASARNVVDRSIKLFKEAVSFCDSDNANKRQTIPQLSGSVWEACDALKKTPTSNCTAIGRAITQLAVSMKDVLREMKELKPTQHDSSDGPPTDVTDEDGSFSEGDLGDDLSTEEMEIAQLATDVVTNALTAVKEIIRFITGLLRKSNRESAEKEYVDSLERILGHCQEMGSELNDLGACVYPPQEISQMKLITKKIDELVGNIHEAVETLNGSPEDLYRAFTVLKNSLIKLRCAFGDVDLAPKMESLAV
ncbi:cyclin-D1-binding protein 1 homolog [Dioscorea cayenensis subsp. rotundata]|uniref:Cyclin-D1-binding protein 1 homolog n=1 Tax=Dioscorea cayennensis subsp. rotundata TaxID=55577 RepID=A0AB40BF35_DIOCR|nr:cyclin-D1-binding protein 1 homolog [Dioscorea cayenensis subsp. rotundata]